MFAIISSIMGFSLFLVSQICFACCHIPIGLLNAVTFGWAYIITLPFDICCFWPVECFVFPVFSCVCMPCSNCMIDIAMLPCFLACPPVWCILALPILCLDGFACTLGIGFAGFFGVMSCVSSPLICCGSIFLVPPALCCGAVSIPFMFPDLVGSLQGMLGGFDIGGICSAFDISQICQGTPELIGSGQAYYTPW